MSLDITNTTQLRHCMGRCCKGREDVMLAVGWVAARRCSGAARRGGNAADEASRQTPTHGKAMVRLMVWVCSRPSVREGFLIFLFIGGKKKDTWGGPRKGHMSIYRGGRSGIPRETLSAAQLWTDLCIPTNWYIQILEIDRHDLQNARTVQYIYREIRSYIVSKQY
jgi:hypothetical protein